MNNNPEQIGQIIQRCPELNQQNTQTLEPLSISINEPKYIKPKHRFYNASKENVAPEIWKKINEIFKKEDLGLFIYGKVGTGKTYLCHVLKKEIKKILKNQRTEIISVPELFLRIKNTFNKEHLIETEEEIIKEMSGDYIRYDREINILFLDDLGIEKPSEWAQQTLYTIVDRRYLNCRKTFFTSNFSLDELVERIGDRIPSRIAEMCKVIELKGKDRRLP